MELAINAFVKQAPEGKTLLLKELIFQFLFKTNNTLRNTVVIKTLGVLKLFGCFTINKLNFGQVLINEVKRLVIYLSVLKSSALAVTGCSPVSCLTIWIKKPNRMTNSLSC
ncbi:hypothetical protein ALQ57_200035 [Pseudomonas amygdali pv. hibisci]|nr:hypothetical protein ALQ57_200035 [Pseudomonas amygdali pv. hibisci]